MANDLFAKRQRLLKLSLQHRQMIDTLAAQALEAEFQTAEAEYLEAKAVFARGMKSARSTA